MQEIVLRTEEFEIEIAKGHSIYISELDEDGNPTKAVYIDWKDLATIGS